MTKCDQRCILTVKEKEKVMDDAKKIIFYAKGGFSLCAIGELDHDELYRIAQHISQFGDLPTVRRAIRLFNNDPKVKKDNKIEPQISARIKNKLEKEKLYKQIKNQSLIMSTGTFILPFD